MALGMIGIFIPVLPTTPFLLLASVCYLRSSKRMYDWLINHKIFGAYIYSYLTHKAIPMKIKISAIVFLWITLMTSVFLVPSVLIKAFLMIVGIGVTAHLLTLKTMNREDFDASIKNRK